VGRRGYLSSVGASAALAAAGALALLLASLYVSFNGWPGLREPTVQAGAVELAGGEPPSSAETRSLRLRGPSAQRRAAKRAKAASSRVKSARQRVKGTWRRRAPVAAAHFEPSEESPTVAGAPGSSVARDRVGEVLDGARGVADDAVDDAGETVPGVVDPFVDRGVEVVGQGGQGFGGVLAP
jgi:hypothetical protein